MGNVFCSTSPLRRDEPEYVSVYNPTEGRPTHIRRRSSSTLVDPDMPVKPRLSADTKKLILTQFAVSDSKSGEPTPHHRNDTAPGETGTLSSHIDDNEIQPPTKEEYPFEIPHEEAEITPEEEEMMSRIQNDLGSKLDVVSSDMCLRYVRGYRHLEPWFEQSRDALAKLIEMCHKYDLYSLPNNYPNCVSQFLPAWPAFIYGQDKFGHPVVYNEACKTPLPRFKKIVIGKSLTDERLEQIKLFMYTMTMIVEERKQALTQRYGVRLYTHVQVLDVSAMGLGHITSSDVRRLIFTMIDCLQEIGGECIFRFFIINAPWSFKKIADLCEPFVDPSTRQKVRILGTDFLETMLEIVPRDQIPKEYGGTGRWDIVPKFGLVDTDEH